MINELRQDTPGCSNRTHLNNAGASLPPLPVLQAMQQYLELEGNIGGYEAADLMHPELEGFYTAMAQMLHTKPRNIAFANSATDAYARVLSSIPWKAGDMIVTTDNDYSSNQIAFLALEKRFQVKIIALSTQHPDGLDLDDFSGLAVRYAPRLVAVSHVPTNNGQVLPIAELGKICRKHGLLYLVDACQSAGQMPLDVQAIGCDFLTATMRKFMRGPRGAGFLYAADRVLDAGMEMMLPDMRSATWTGFKTYESRTDARRFEYWEMSPALIMGSKVATEYALELGLEWIADRIKELAGLSRTLLADIPGVEVLDRGDQLCGIVTAFAGHWDQQTILKKLAAENINCRLTGRVVESGTAFPKSGVDWALRVSPHYYNTADEIRQLVEVLRREFPL